MRIIEKAILKFSDETNESGIAQRVSALRTAFILQNFDYMERTQKGEVIPDEEVEKFEMMQKWFTGIEKSFMIEVRLNRINGGAQNQMGDCFLEEIKNMKSLTGEIVQKIGDNGIQD